MNNLKHEFEKMITRAWVALVIVVVFLLALIILWPFVIIGALNILFPLLSIPYSFLSWLSVVILNITTFALLVLAINRK